MFFPDQLWQANWLIKSLALPNSFSPQTILIPEWFVFLYFYLLLYFFVLGFVQFWDNHVYKINITISHKFIALFWKVAKI